MLITLKQNLLHFKYISQFKIFSRKIQKLKGSSKTHLRIVFTLGIIVLSIYESSSQFLNDEFCGNKEVLTLDYRKKPWKGKNQFLLDYLKKIDYKDNIDSVRFRIPVKFWIYRNDDGSGGVTDERVKVFMDSLNHFHKLNNTGFRFYIREIESVNKTKRLNLGYFVEAPLQTIFNHTKACVNIYVCDFIKKKANGATYVVRGTYNIVTKSVMLQRNTSSTGLTHEIGHYFGLLHPHRNYKSGKNKQESVSRTRAYKGSLKKGLICERNGDGLADTPAEPRLNFLVDNNCNFSGQALTDNWGDHYQSETNNIMSYPTHYKCRNNFTLSQKSVMLYKASENKYAKYWNTKDSANKIYHFDIHEPDNTVKMASIIKSNEKQNHTFHKIFTTGKKGLATDKTDWLKFELNTENTSNILIKFTPDKIVNDEITITIYDEDNKLIKTINTSKQIASSQIQLKTLKSGWYFIEINKKQSVSKKLYNYSVELIIE